MKGIRYAYPDGVQPRGDDGPGADPGLALLQQELQILQHGHHSRHSIWVPSPLSQHVVAYGASLQ